MKVECFDLQSCILCEDRKNLVSQHLGHNTNFYMKHQQACTLPRSASHGAGSGGWGKGARNSNYERQGKNGRK